MVKKILTILCFAIIAAYIAGIVLMIFGQFGNGITLWVISTVVGALVLYAKGRVDKRRADEAELEKEERDS